MVKMKIIMKAVPNRQANLQEPEEEQESAPEQDESLALSGSYV